VWLNSVYLTRMVKAAGAELVFKIGQPQAAVLAMNGDLIALVMPMVSTASDPSENEAAIAIFFEQAVQVTA
jgi:hypothetical protein